MSGAGLQPEQSGQNRLEQTRMQPDDEKASFSACKKTSFSPVRMTKGRFLFVRQGSISTIYTEPAIRTKSSLRRNRCARRYPGADLEAVQTQLVRDTSKQEMSIKRPLSSLLYYYDKYRRRPARYQPPFQSIFSGKNACFSNNIFKAPTVGKRSADEACAAGRTHMLHKAEAGSSKEK